jgi:hypothetical protein
MIFLDIFNYHNSNIIIIITKFLHLIRVNSQKYKKMLKRFLFSYLVYGNQILLNLHMEDYHFVFILTQMKEWKIAIFLLFHLKHNNGPNLTSCWQPQDKFINKWPIKISHVFHWVWTLNQCWLAIEFWPNYQFV